MTAPTSPRGPTGAWPLYRAMVGVGLLCGLLIVGVFQLTRASIEENEAQALEAAVLEVLPGARSSRPYAWRPEVGFRPAPPESPKSDVVHAAYDDRGALVGVAIRAIGMGYQDRIGLLYGYAPARDEIVGMRVLQSRETPGLGDRIESEASFLQSFAALDVTLTADGTALAHPVQAVRHGEKDDAWEVDGITGATVSSHAVASIVSRSASEWLPRIRSHVAAFASPEGGDS